MSLSERINERLMDTRFQDPLYPPVQSTPIVLAAEPVECPVGTHRLYVGETGNVVGKLIGDQEDRTWVGVPAGTVLEGMFFEINNTSTAGSILALHTYNDA